MGGLEPDAAATSAGPKAVGKKGHAELRAHAEHEERFIHPLLRAKASELAAEIESKHADLDVEVGRLTGGLALPYLYRALTRFTSVYLARLAREEDDAMPAMWAACPTTTSSAS